MMKISEFQVKDVVSVSNGKRLGHITDLDINISTGKIEAIIIGGGGKMMGFFNKEHDVVIPWNNIVKIGSDVILVQYRDVNMSDETVK